jgi:hypothetical protein
LNYFLGEVRATLVLLQVHADQHLARGAEVLHLGLVAGAVEVAADGVDLGRLLVADLDQRAAGKLDRQVEPAEGEEADRGEEGDERDDVEDERIPHERYGSADLEELHLSHFQVVLPMNRRPTRRRWP